MSWNCTNQEKWLDDFVIYYYSESSGRYSQDTWEEGLGFQRRSVQWTT